MFEVESQTPRQSLIRPHVGLGGHKIGLSGVDGRLCDFDLDLIGLLVEFDQQITFADSVVIVD